MTRTDPIPRRTSARFRPTSIRQGRCAGRGSEVPLYELRLALDRLRGVGIALGTKTVRLSRLMPFLRQPILGLGDEVGAQCPSHGRADIEGAARTEPSEDGRWCAIFLLGITILMSLTRRFLVPVETSFPAIVAAFIVASRQNAGFVGISLTNWYADD